MARARRSCGRERALRFPAAGLRAARGREEAPGAQPCASPGGREGARRCRPRRPPAGPARCPAAVTAAGTSGAARAARCAPGLGLRRPRPAASLCPSEATAGTALQRPEGSAPASRRRPRCSSPAAPALGAGGGLGGACAGVGTALTSWPQVRGRPLLSTCATSAGFSWQVCRPPLRTSSAGQWSPDPSLNRKLELEEEEKEEKGACRNPVRDESPLRQRWLLGHLSWLFPTQVSTSFCNQDWALVLPSGTRGKTGAGVGE